METVIIVIFVVGYLAIALEHLIKINKTATALITGVLCWTLFAWQPPNESFLQEVQVLEFIKAHPAIDQPFLHFVIHSLSHHLGEIASILFFLMGAMTIVELVDAHHGFRIITDRIKTNQLRTLMWLVCWITFFLSAILDNLTTTIVMVSLVRKLIPAKETRLFMAGMIVIAANAGGAWSPIGDVTTTMLWIGGQITSGAIVKSLLLPSMVCLLVPSLILHFRLKGTVGAPDVGEENGKPNSGRKWMLAVGVGSLVFVPIFKSLTHLPPFMGILLGLGLLWIVSEVINPAADELEKKKFSAAAALARIDVPSVLFFLGILLAVGALESMQTLHHFASALDRWLGDERIIITLIGVLSAIIDNVPLVAACVGMYDLASYPADSTLWHYLAYCAGTGGSLLIIGSAAGVAAMGMEKIDFIWYLKRISALALIGYLAGAGTYIVLQNLS
jgi:Na+/H+ antiporter NhaD/arsenite permease-like protein